MRATVAMALCAAGCFSDRGIAIEVDVGDTGATDVALYVGSRGCDGANTNISCGGGIAPPGAAAHLAGEVWYYDDLTPYAATVTSGKATFHLKADVATTLPIMIAVGSRDAATLVGTATLRDVVVPADTARVVTTTLVAASTITASSEGMDRVIAWPATDAAPGACVVVEHAPEGMRDFIVPFDDPDCDGLRGECDPAGYHGALPGGMAPRANCAVENEAKICVLGSLGCSDDGRPVDSSCAPQGKQTCIPSRLCDCPDLDPACMQQAVKTDLMIPHITCNIPVSPAGPVIDLCPGKEVAEINLDRFYPGARCEDQPLLAGLQLTGFGANHSFGGAIMELSSAQEPCRFDLTWKTGTRATPDPTDFGVIRLSTGHGSLLVPIVLRFSGLCGPLEKFECIVDENNADPMWTCAP